MILSGNSTEYLVAKQFFNLLWDEIADEGCKEIKLFFVPGNHDCDFSSEPASRALIADGLARGGANQAIDKGVIEICTSVQKNFFQFASSMEDQTSTTDDGLWKESLVECDGYKIRLFGINVAWLSKIKEKYGELLFPVNQYKNRIIKSDAHFNVVVMHHPANWMINESYQAFRALFRQNNTIILSGHEHNGGGYQVRSGATEYIHSEALALVPEKITDNLGFNSIQIDPVKLAGLITLHNLNGKLNEITPFSLRTLPSISSQHQLKDDFLNELADPGGNFGGLSKSSISLNDIFTYPELKVISSGTNNRRDTSSEAAISGLIKTGQIMLLGRELCGKTTLLYKAFEYYYGQGLYPIYLKAEIFNSADEANINAKIREATKNQYISGDDVLSEKRETIVFLIDDVEELLRIPNLLKGVLDFCKANSARQLITAENGFNVTEFLDKELSLKLKEYHCYDILPFGHANRYELVKKWCQTVEILTTDEFESKIHLVETTLNTVIGKNLAPAYPFYLLIILQSMDGDSTQALQNSSYAYYYQHLITKGLKEAGVRANRHDEVMNYLANLAWYIKNQSLKSVTETALQGFNAAFGERYVNVVLTDRLRQLTKAKLLINRNGVYSFSYPYIYYFFLGSYLSANFENPEVIKAIDEMCSHLRDKESGNTILFLTHHNKSPQIIEKIVAVLDNCFASSVPFVIDTDTKSLDSLITTTSQRSLEYFDIESAKLEARKSKDIAETTEEETDLQINNNSSEIGDRLREMQLLLRSVDIVGQILKNYYGSLNREDKQKLLQKLFQGPMRLMGYVMSLIGNDPSALAIGIAARLQEDFPNASLKDRETQSRKITFDMLGMLIFSLIARPAYAISIDELDDDLGIYVDKDGNMASKIVQIASWMLRPSNRHTAEMSALAAELKNRSPFAYTLLQSLGIMHIRMFNMSEDEKQKLCAGINVTVDNTRRKEAVTSAIKILEKR